MLSRSAHYAITVLGTAVILGHGAIADDLQIPRKVANEEEAMSLAAQAIGGGTFYFEENVGSPFFVFDDLPPSPVNGINSVYAVNPWTGDVWALWSCRRLSTSILRKSQAKIRKSFTATEMKQYARLRRLRPGCLND